MICDLDEFIVNVSIVCVCSCPPFRCVSMTVAFHERIQTQNDNSRSSMRRKCCEYSAVSCLWNVVAHSDFRVHCRTNISSYDIIRFYFENLQVKDVCKQTQESKKEQR